MSTTANSSDYSSAIIQDGGPGCAKNAQFSAQFLRNTGRTPTENQLKTPLLHRKEPCNYLSSAKIRSAMGRAKQKISQPEIPQDEPHNTHEINYL